MRSTLVLLILLAGFGLAGCSSLSRQPYQPPKQTILGADRVELPSTFVDGFACVDLKINGKGPYRFIVDTGWAGMGVSTRVVREAGISFSQKTTARGQGAGGHIMNLPFATVDQIDCPEFSLRAVSADLLTSEIEDGSAKLGIDNFGGVIGMLPFTNVLLEIDFPHQKVSVARLGSGIPAKEQGIPYWGITPKVTITTPSAKHAKETAEIDTGSWYGISLNDSASYPTMAGLAKGDEYTTGLGGIWRSLSGQLAGDIKLGSVIWRDPAIRNSAIFSRIGAKALAAFKLVIDQKKNMLWLVGDDKIITMTLEGPLEPDGRQAVYGFACVPVEDGALVKEVDPGSRAELAGLKVGDHIAKGTREWDENSGKVPRRVRLEISHGSEKLEITMSLWEPLPDGRKPAEEKPAVKAGGQKSSG